MREGLGLKEGFEEFHGLLDLYAGHIQSTGRKVFRTSREQAREIFESLSPDRQARLLKRLELDLAVLDEAVEAQEDITDSKRLLWRFLGKIKYTPCSDILNYIEDGDVIELYSPDQVHLWQNILFFDWISVPLERVYSDTWYQASKRDDESYQKLAIFAGDIFSGKIRASMTPPLSWHVVEEIDSELLLKFELRVKVMSPVFQDHQTVGLITVNQCRTIS